MQHSACASRLLALCPLSSHRGLHGYSPSKRSIMDQLSRGPTPWYAAPAHLAEAPCKHHARLPRDADPLFSGETYFSVI
ncbi:hypothetical protein T484DRAFT_1989250 [Baffinella frigidus]|nr:hypothetical protein T484DRAFT_1989250 [Cryptophyta sp. CCMP2293]